MKKYIYLLWSHDENGPEGLKATHLRDNVVPLAESMDANGWFERSGVPVISTIAWLLASSDETLAEGDGIHSIMKGWGGLHLQVVELYEGEQ